MTLKNCQQKKGKPPTENIIILYSFMDIFIPKCTIIIQMYVQTQMITQVSSELSDVSAK